MCATRRPTPVHPRRRARCTCKVSVDRVVCLPAFLSRRCGQTAPAHGVSPAAPDSASRCSTDGDEGSATGPLHFGVRPRLFVGQQHFVGGVERLVGMWLRLRLSKGWTIPETNSRHAFTSGCITVRLQSSGHCCGASPEMLNV